MTILSTEPNTMNAPLSSGNIQSIWKDDPMSVVLMLFDKTLLHIGRARSTLSGWDNECYQAHIVNAVSVLEVLQMTLSHNGNNSMAANLDDIYRYIMSLLIESKRSNPHSVLNEVTKILIEIRESLSIYVNKSSRMSQH